MCIDRRQSTQQCPYQMGVAIVCESLVKMSVSLASSLGQVGSHSYTCVSVFPHTCYAGIPKFNTKMKQMSLMDATIFSVSMN